VCIEPQEGQAALGEATLPPIPPENRLSHVANAPKGTTKHDLRAHVDVSLNTEGLYLADAIAAALPNSVQSQIQAIMQAVICKRRELLTNKGQIRLSVEVLERDQ